MNRRQAIAVVLGLCLVPVAAVIGFAGGKPSTMPESARTARPAPVPMLRVPAVINDVHDGDTLSVSFEFSARIRLIDCWAPELKSGEPGTRSKANLIRLTSKNQNCMVEIPLHDDIGRSTSLGRVLARVTVEGQAKDLSTQQVEGGFATKSKE